MDVADFHQGLKLSIQDDAEARSFVEDITVVRLRHIVRSLTSVASEEPLGEPPSSEPHCHWDDLASLALSGVDSAWLSGLEDPGECYLHIGTVLEGEWRLVGRYLEMALLSSKQRSVLFPLLKAARPPACAKRNLDDLPGLADECRRLNGLLHWARESGMDWRVFSLYQRHVGIHGASQNVAARVGEVGGRIAIADALEELDPKAITDVVGERLPKFVRRPVEVYDYLYGVDSTHEPVRALLLRNGRAVIFTSDPDVAVFQSLGTRYGSAQAALEEWESVRRDVTGRSRRVHVFAEGEIKTATDRQSLHERLALGSRETREEVRTDRFLLMAMLVQGIFDGTGARTRRSPALASKDVVRFSDVFNLQFAWGYDGARERHSEHWEWFKRRLTTWCLE